MTKVEELRRIVVNALEQHLIRDCEYALANEAHDTVNRLISAAHAEGVAEGKASRAEVFAERLDRLVAEEWANEGRPMPWVEFKQAILRAAIAAEEERQENYAAQASVLAPTKEPDRGNI